MWMEGKKMAIDGISRNMPGNTASFQSKSNVVSEAVPVKEEAFDGVKKESIKDRPILDENEPKELTNEQIKKAVSDLNKRMSESTSCQFGIHEGTGRVTIKIIDKQTKEILKEFPAEETLKMIEKAWEIAGIMVDEKL